MSAKLSKSSTADRPFTPVRPTEESRLDENRLERNRQFEQAHAVITKMNIPPEKLSRINAVLETNVISETKEAAIRRIIGGVCSVCRAMPSHIVSYNYQDATRIEQYCHVCLARNFPNYKEE